MDLAKIRKKARHGQPVPLLPDPVSTGTAAGPQLWKISRRRPKRAGNPSPLEIILAGREAAGCNTDTKADIGLQIPEAAADKEDVLCFSVSGETYGINIMQIKEILKPRPVTEVPRAPSFVSGVISLRGVILPVLDLHDRLGLEHPASSGRERLVVVKTGPDGDLAGLLVDQVFQVVSIPAAIEPAPPNPAGIDRDFVAGIGRADNRIVFLLNPERLVDLHLSKGTQP
jgi:purine-binding chemotaxis protein CheW